MGIMYKKNPPTPPAISNPPRHFHHLSQVLPRLGLDVAKILGVEGITIARANGVVVAATVLSIVGAILLAPCLGVERAVGSIRDVVDGDEVSVEEVAGIVCAVRARVAVVVSGVGLAGSGALAGVVDTREVLHANVGVLAGGVERGVDGTAQPGGSVEARLRSRG